MKIRFLLPLLALGFVGCQVNPKYKDSEIVKKIEQMDAVEFIHWSTGGWTMTVRLSRKVSFNGSGSTLEAAYEDALKGREELCSKFPG